MSKFLPTIALTGLLMSSAAVFAQTTNDAADAAAAGANTATQATEQAADAAANAADQVKDAAGTAADAATTAAEKVEGAVAGATDAQAVDTQATDTQATDTQATDTQADGTQSTDAQAGASGDATQQTQGQQAQGQQGQDQQAQAPEEDPTYVKTTHGDWDIKCFRNEQGEDPCQMFQLLKEENGNPIAEFGIFKIKQGQAVAGATIVVPLGTLLSEPLKMSLDGGRARTYPYSFCTMVGCYARIGLTAEEVNAMKRGVKGTLTIIPAQAPDQKVNINVSLSGFTAAFEEASVMGN